MSALRVAAIITPDPVCVDEDATVDDVTAEMHMRRVAQLPVVWAGRVIGMISRFELITALERSLSRNESGEKA